jgi:hypothetical protein
MANAGNHDVRQRSANVAENHHCQQAHRKIEQDKGFGSPNES